MAASHWVSASGDGGVTIVVNDPAGEGGSCPGRSCTLYAAWSSLTGQTDATILLNVSATLSAPLYRVPDFVTKPFTVTLLAVSRSGHTITPSESTLSQGNAFMTVDLFQGDHHRDILPMSIVLDGITVTGFRPLHGRGLICISEYYYGFCWGQSPPGTQVEKEIVGSGGGKATPILVMKNTVLSNNNYTNPTGSYKSLVFVGARSNHSVVINQTSIGSNSVTILNYKNEAPAMAGLLFTLDHRSNPGAPSPVVSLHMAGSKFGHNLILYPSRPKFTNASLVFANGNIHGQGVVIDGNVMEQGSGVLASRLTEGNSGGNIYLEDSHFSNGWRRHYGGWSVEAFHVHFTNVYLSSTSRNMVRTVDDQYYTGCTWYVFGGGLQAGILSGWQFFNRDPTLPASPLAIGDTTLGFANCTQSKPWLPCPSGSTCTNVGGEVGGSIGYTCSA